LSDEWIGLDSENYRSVDITDESLRDVQDFFKKIGSKILYDKFFAVLKEKKFITNEGGVNPDLPGTVFVPFDTNPEERTWSIILHFLLEVQCIAPVIGGFRNAFSAFLKEKTKFDLNSFDPELVVFLAALEKSKGPDFVGNEGYIRFKDNAYTKMFKVDDVSLADCEGTISKIRQIFYEVAIHEMHDFNNNSTEIQMAEEDVPGQKIVVKRLSNGLLPTAISKKDGTITINENFVKVMHKLFYNLRGAEGRIKRFREEYLYSTKAIGNLFYSIIYCVALHEIRGHFPINEFGFPEFRPDEKFAQGERGRKHLYVNLLAMLFYWIVILEHEYGDILGRAKSLIAENPEIFKGLTSEQKKMLPNHLLELCGELIRKKGFPYPYHSKLRSTNMTWEKYKEIIERSSKTQFDGDDVSRVDIVKISLHPEELFDWLFFQTEKLTEKQIIKKLKKHSPEDISLHLQILRDLNLVSISYPAQEKENATTIGHQDSDEPAFKLRYMTTDMAKKIRRILEKYSFNNESDFKKLKSEIFKEIEFLWAEALLDATKRSHTFKYKMKTTKRRIYPRNSQKRQLVPGTEQNQQFLIAIETDWIPVHDRIYVQALIQEAARLNGVGTIRIIRGTSTDLASKVMKTVNKEKISFKKVLVLGSPKTLAQPAFTPLRPNNGLDREKAFFAAIDASELKSEKLEVGEMHYIRIMELLTMFIRKGANLKVIGEHANFQINQKNPRYIIIKLKAEPIDVESAKTIYLEQLKILRAA